MPPFQITHPKDLSRLRRITLGAQGLLQAKPYGLGLEGVHKAINHIGYVQIDTISVVERAHHHVLYSRVPNFKPAMIHQMLLARDIFEYWTHAAAFIPMDDYRFSLPYKHAIRGGQTHWYKTPDRKLMKKLLARIRSEGPLRSRDLEANVKKRSGWWDLKPAKKALEKLYMEGDLMVSDREGFQKTYDLTERVLPPHVNTKVPSINEFAEHIVEQQLRCHGLVTLKGLTYQRRNSGLRKAVKHLISDYLTEGILESIQLNNGEVFYIHAGSLENPLPKLSGRLLILSPFDNAVIQRERLTALFQYDYQIECYVPEAKRQYGYFSLPLLYRDTFIGRMDCKAHRKTRELEIKFLHFEKHNFDEDKTIDAFAKALKPFLRFQQCDTITLSKVHPKYLTKPLQSALKTFSS